MKLSDRIIAGKPVGREGEGVGGGPSLGCCENGQNQ